MFTGLIEEIGIIESSTPDRTGLALRIGAEEILGDLKVDDSVAVEGICLTAVKIENRSFTAQAVAETVTKTTLSQFRTGRKVNLERALQPSGRMGGHFVQGHVDCVAVITAIFWRGEGKILEVQLPQQFSDYVVAKGSIAVNGVSLTVAEVSGNYVKIWLIPHTLAHTTLGCAEEGDEVNIEVDILGKYVAQFSKRDKNSDGLSEQQMKDWGYR